MIKMAKTKRTEKETKNLEEIFSKKLKEKDFNEEDLSMALLSLDDFYESRKRIEAIIK